MIKSNYKNIIHKTTYIEQLSSTNDYFRLNPDKCTFVDGEVVIADFQTSGKGLSKNTWESKAGQNLTFSLYLKNPNLTADKQFYLAKTISIALCNYLNSYGFDFKIKWPNDLYIDKKKIAGVLIENTIQTNAITESVIGIGLNINQIMFGNNLPNPISLKMVTGTEFNLSDEFSKLIPYIDSQLEVLYSHNFTEIDNQYMNCLFLYNSWNEFISDENIIKGKITGVDEFGYLTIQSTNNEILRFGFKEIEYVL